MKMKEISTIFLAVLGSAAAVAAGIRIYQHFAWKKQTPLLGVVQPKTKSQKIDEGEDEFFG
jgi:hypothetical protein